MIRKGLTYSLPVLAAITAMTVYGWMMIEPGALLPSHFNIHGVADRHMRKEPLLLFFPVLAVSLTAMFALLPQITPRRDNLYKSAAFYLTAWVGVLFILAAAELMIIRAAMTGASPSLNSITVPVAPLIMAVGYFMATTRSNWLGGVRTPWTLSSEHAWKIANRTTGWLFVLAGLGSIAATFAHSDRAGIAVLVAGALTAGLAGVVVSYFAWRADPERRGAPLDS